MPMYGYVCDSCGFDEDVYIKLVDFESTFVECPYCVLNMRRKFSPIPTIGPMPSKPFVVQALDKEFTSTKELRDYEQSNSDFKMIGVDDLSWKNKKWKIREAAERQAKKSGYRDLDEMKVKKAEIKKQKLANNV